jgi:hypothetical protein
VKTMDQRTFWSLVEQAHKESGPDLTCQAAWVRDFLSGLAPDEIVTYERIYRAFHWDSRMQKVFFSLSKVVGPVSLLEFEFFRHWLIAQGQQVFDLVTSQPERLAECVSGRVWPWEDYAWMSAAEDAYERRTGCSLGEMEELVGTLPLRGLCVASARSERRVVRSKTSMSSCKQEGE